MYNFLAGIDAWVIGVIHYSSRIINGNEWLLEFMEYCV